MWLVVLQGNSRLVTVQPDGRIVVVTVGQYEVGVIWSMDVSVGGGNDVTFDGWAAVKLGIRQFRGRSTG
jgi:hypothetical protein